MNNITINEVSVNHFSKEEWEELAFYTEGVKNGFYRNPDIAYILPDGTTFLAPPAFKEKAKNCPFSVPQTESKNDFLPKKKKRIPAKERYKNERNLLATGKLENWMILTVYEKIQSRKTLIHLHKADNVYLTYPAPYKGSRAYNNALATKVKERAELVIPHCKYRYFLTITCDPKLYDKNRTKSWIEWRDKVSEFMRYMTRKWNILYQGVTESTANGFPHAHFVIYSDHPLCGESKPKNCNKDIRKGKFIDWIIKHSPAPVFNLKHTTEGNLQVYLVKYITKVYNAKEDETKTRPDKIKGDEKKGMLTNIFQVITGTRGYMTNSQKTVDEYIKKTQEKEIIEKVTEKSRKKRDTEVDRILKENDNTSEALEKFFEHLRRQAEYLIDFRINSPINCGRLIYMIGNKFLQYVPKAERGMRIGKPPDFLSNPALKKTCTCCKGCSLMDFREKTQDLRAEKDIFSVDRVGLTQEEFAQIHISLYLKKKKEEKERKDELRAKLGVEELFEEVQERKAYARAQREYEERQGKVSYLPRGFTVDVTPDTEDFVC